MLTKDGQPNSDWFNNLQPQVLKRDVHEKWFEDLNNRKPRDNGQHTIIQVDKLNLRAVGTVEVGYKNRTEPIKDEQAINLITYVGNKAKDINQLLKKQKVIYPNKELQEKTRQTFKTLLEVTLREHKYDVLYDRVAGNILNIVAADIVTIYGCNDTDDSQKVSVDERAIAGKLKHKYQVNENEISKICLSLINENKNVYDSKTDQNSNSIFRNLSFVGSGEQVQNYSFVKSERIKSAAGILLKINKDTEEKTVGVMFIYYRRHHEFPEEEQQYIEELAGIAADAISNPEFIKKQEAEFIEKTSKLLESAKVGSISMRKFAEFAYEFEHAKNRGEFSTLEQQQEFVKKLEKKLNIVFQSSDYPSDYPSEEERDKLSRLIIKRIRNAGG
ncbi:MAG: GAF domain-containing protein [Xenococcaceae cyanobacterium MO_188.B32]|nr:GAF domain-containing protein [Xenococcaceae cyanobacterium MO_188.B32]